MEPHHAPRHARKRGGRWLLPALVGSACAVFLLCLLPHLMPTASASGQPAASPAPVESAPDSGTPGISVNWEPSPLSRPGGAGGSPLVPAAGEPGEPAAPGLHRGACPGGRRPV